MRTQIWWFGVEDGSQWAGNMLTVSRSQTSLHPAITSHKLMNWTSCTRHSFLQHAAHLHSQHANKTQPASDLMYKMSTILQCTALNCILLYCIYSALFLPVLYSTIFDSTPLYITLLFSILLLPTLLYSAILWYMFFFCALCFSVPYFSLLWCT